MDDFIIFLLGLLIGCAATFFFCRKQIRFSEEKFHHFKELQENFTQHFKGLSSEALKHNNEAFLQLAEKTFVNVQQQALNNFELANKSVSETLKPIRESLDKFDGKLQELERHRVGAYSALKEQITMLVETERCLKQETSNLVQALRKPQVRGRWGELQLKRVVELAGMLNHCDFYEQVRTAAEEGSLRPDLIVKLPSQKTIIIDAKVPLDAFLSAQECTEDQKKTELFANHARQIKQHILLLSRKSYWTQFSNSPEFVVLFLPGETFFSAALEHDPSLIEFGATKQVILATPTTLIALLRCVAYGWKQEGLSRYVDEVSNLGKELYKRISDLGGHWAKVGKNLGSAVQAYNRAVGSLESRVLISARRFNDLKTDMDIEKIDPIDEFPREFQADELKAKEEASDHC